MSSIQRRFWDEIIQNGDQLAKGQTNRFWAAQIGFGKIGCQGRKLNEECDSFIEKEVEYKRGLKRDVVCES